MEQLHQSIIILSTLTQGITNRTHEIIKQKFHKEPKVQEEGVRSMMAALYKMTFIETKAFMDEYDGHFGVTTDKKYKKRILHLKECLNPFMKVIRKWDWNFIRNEFSAHNLRRKSDSQFIFSDNSFLEKNIPRNFNDVVIISNMLAFLMQAVEKEFHEEAIEGRTAFGNIELGKIDLHVSTTKEQVSDITVIAITAANRKLAEKGKLYSIAVQPTNNWNEL